MNVNLPYHELKDHLSIALSAQKRAEKVHQERFGPEIGKPMVERTRRLEQAIIELGLEAPPQPKK